MDDDDDAWVSARSNRAFNHFSIQLDGLALGFWVLHLLLVSWQGNTGMQSQTSARASLSAEDHFVVCDLQSKKSAHTAFLHCQLVFSHSVRQR